MIVHNRNVVFLVSYLIRNHKTRWPAAYLRGRDQSGKLGAHEEEILMQVLRFPRWWRFKSKPSQLWRRSVLW